MRRILYILVALVVAAVVAGCGSATEVGNPTGEVPQTIVGKIDSSTLPDYFMDASVAGSAEAVDLTSLSVIATSEAGYESVSPLDEEGYFSVDLYIDTVYSMYLTSGLQTVADFSFEQDNYGNRQNRLYFSMAVSAFDLGLCRYESGEIFPENEPRRQMGGNGFQGP